MFFEIITGFLSNIFNAKNFISEFEYFYKILNATFYFLTKNINIIEYKEKEIIIKT